MGTALLIDECEHGSDPYCCVPCANAKGVERIGGPGLDLDEVPTTRPMKANYDTPCRWTGCTDDIEKGDLIVAIDALGGFVHWSHVSGG